MYVTLNTTNGVAHAIVPNNNDDIKEQGNDFPYGRGALNGDFS